MNNEILVSALTVARVGQLTLKDLSLEQEKDDNEGNENGTKNRKGDALASCCPCDTLLERG